MGTLFTILQWFFVVLEVILIILILLRKADIVGLSSTFGGVGGDNALGVKTQKQLDKTIIWIAGIFLIIAILLNKPNLWQTSSPAKDTKQEQQIPRK